ncbi:squalene--hopene cyclase [Fredinandcohnia sp. QZ13]|uniref:squalene--hopene cyclase n=1 Tax=Fredinandcohnia sp. QZ13 TaxID=3073144 RepID=UPI002853233D|nr:squalene--hopene cyclase [Fredinandcohnia sp. QZ13]MDR4886236.1 squalene--hopene cyclase [Fredinandcohnia sp. QZ13]
MFDKVNDGLGQLIDSIRKDQSSNGAWKYPFETGISTDCYMIILLRSLEINDEKLIQQLVERILSRQEDNGAWKLFYDEGDGNISATVEAYYALLYSGYIEKQDPKMKRAKSFIVKNGGLTNIQMLTKFMLALSGQHRWPSFNPLPVELILLPHSCPIHFYRFSVFGRANLTPIMILADKKFSLTTNRSPDLSDLTTKRDENEFNFGNSQEWRSFYLNVKQAIDRLIGLPSHLHQLAIEQAKHYMLQRIEPDGTFLGYFSSTFLMIFALLSLGYSKKHSSIINAINGLKGMKTVIDGHVHMQYTTADVWNTALLGYALQEAGVPSNDSMIKKANHYLLQRQHLKYGDWAVQNPSGVPGGWGFADMNTIHPDVDDTTATLRSIARIVKKVPVYRQSWDRGLMWLLTMQNADGGWPAFEKNTDSKLLSFLPIEKAEYILTDPSSADLTGRTLEYLGKYTNLKNNHPSVKSAIQWLYKDQKDNGSWYGRWGICYIYGTWAAVTGLRAVGVLSTYSSIQRAVTWLESIQNPDGGWGESCNSDRKLKYVPLKTSTLTHTAWAVDALISVSDKPSNSINKGVDFLLSNLDRDDWTTSYPKGQGMAGDFYMHYHSYRYIFPLLALAHYKTKYTEKS